MSDKEKNEARAKEIFAAYAGKDTVYFTSDGLAFLNESDAKNHGKSQKDDTVRKVEREDVYPSSDETDFEDDEDDDFLVDVGPDKALERARAEYLELFGAPANEDSGIDDLADAIVEKRKEIKATADKAKADQKAAAAKAKADQKAAADKAKADQKAAADKAKADQKAAADQTQA